MGGRKGIEAMRLTPSQKEMLVVLVDNRSESSHVAGGLVLNAWDDSARFSHNFDFFHDAIEDLAETGERDVADRTEIPLLPSDTLANKAH